MHRKEAFRVNKIRVYIALEKIIQYLNIWVKTEFLIFFGFIIQFRYFGFGICILKFAISY